MATATAKIKQPTIPDYSGHYRDEQEQATESDLRLLTSLAQRQMDLETEAAKLQMELDLKLKALSAIAENQLPELMKRLGLKLFKTTSGLVIERTTSFHCSISKENQPAAHAWLNQAGLGSIIKRVFQIRFGRDEEAWARKFQADLARRKKPVNCERTDKVEPSTLKKTLGDRVKAGRDVPLELFGGFERQVTKVKSE